MLFILLSFMAALGTGAICFFTRAFYSDLWMWLLPVSYIGGFLVLLLLSFGGLLAGCALIDPEKEREKDSPVFRRLILWYIDLILTLIPVKLRTHGLEKMPEDGRFLLVCNHLHEIDPAILMHCFPKKNVAFVAKQETRQMFLINKVLPKLLCPTINRENDKEALKTILRCIKLLKEDTVSVGIFPEGRINKYRKLAHFRPGVFKIAQKAKVPVVVCTLQNTNLVLKNLQKLKSTEVQMHLLDVIPVEELENTTTVDLAERIYTMMADDLGPDRVLTPDEEENT